MFSGADLMMRVFSLLSLAAPSKPLASCRDPFLLVVSSYNSPKNMNSRFFCVARFTEVGLSINLEAVGIKTARTPTSSHVLVSFTGHRVGRCMCMLVTKFRTLVQEVELFEQS